MILDTNALSDYADGNQDLLRHLRTSRMHSIPTIVLGEYRFGLLSSHSRIERQKWLDRLENEFEILEITRTTAKMYAIVRHELRELGRPIPENDVWIAALAREHGLSLLSRDVHFDHVPGLVRVSW